MLRRLHAEQPASFAFTPANQEWAEAQITKYPEGRQQSAVIPLLWRAQEQESWLTKPAIEHIGDMLGMPYIRVLEVATFYFMFQLQPVGTVAHIQICGTLSCMICGAEDLMAVAREKISPTPHTVSADGKFSWEEVECLGACSNAPMAQIGKDYYEDLSAENFGKLIDDMAAGNVPLPGPQNGRFAAEPLSGLTSLADGDTEQNQYNASVALASDIGDTLKRIDGTEVPLLTPWLKGGKRGGAKPPKPAAPAKSAVQQAAEAKAPAKKAAVKATAPKAAEKATATAADVPASAQKKPRTMKAPRKAGADDLKMIKGVGPKLEETLNALGFWHFDQVAKWTPEEIAWVDDNLKFKGRIERDGWIEQATTLAAGGTTEFSKRAKY
ncbi:MULTISPECIES: NADH-quinone oxidoreductase subunit E [Pacificibacter]|uniref:NADH-quinone oxidoreductase subunit E n=1 Tax=Pacificibacter TaxID=1042323 RepID=UPI001C08F37F|nr:MULTISPECIES: NADH-quinone oxidoreductase subunit E [Pacificibacter]MBU2935746.1 NADH-quinone oxidoreductase subunit E [Pacificibacter marinus]MDO6614242.1 NADH-quinone oxidoreductase subunit E [Pacificibacter sp. 1_MG-2023]